MLYGAIPITALDMIFRQVKNSWIAVNAHGMQENNAMLDYGPGFEFYPTDSTAEISEIVSRSCIRKQ